MRSKKNHGTWFPNLGTRSDTGDDISSRVIQLNITDQAINLTGVVPLTFDYPQEGEDLDQQSDTLAEIAGSEYYINRIVGKLHAAYSYRFLATGAAPEAVLIGAGLFVARAANADNFAGSADVPIGLPATRDEDYGPLSFNTIREPWMWRRTWVLGAAEARPPALGVQTGWSRFPSSNAGYGSILDGPHLDVKSHRVVHLDERLWLAVSARVLPFSTGAPTAGADPTVLIHFDYRILGKLRKARNTGAF